MRTILVTTYDISPYKGSESSVSWNFVLNMCTTNHLIVLYGKGHDDINKYLRSSNLNNVDFVNVPCIEEDGSGLLYNIRYNIRYNRWQQDLYKKVSSIINENNVDIIHYLNPIGFKEPGYLWKLKIPYIWGPMKGVDKRPYCLFKALSYKWKINSFFRNETLNFLFRYNQRVKKAIKKADYIFSATPNTFIGLKKYHRKESFYMPENGITEMLTKVPINYSGVDEKLNLVWIGRLDENKALIILLEALKKVKNNNYVLKVVGDGYTKDKLIMYCDKYNLNNNIIWYGKIPHSKVATIMEKSHLHVITSLGEATTTTLWEAMSLAVPTLTLDHCGMSGVVCHKCGIKIPIKSYQQVVNEIASNINIILENPSIIKKLSEGVLECSKKYMWSKRITIFNNVYNSICNK